MPFCPNCGTKNVDGSRFCENCGTKLEGITGAADTGENPFPWEQNVTVPPENGMPEADRKPEQPVGQQPEWSSDQQLEQKEVQQPEEPAGTLRPSQLKKERQKEKQNTTHIVKIKKPDIDVKKYRNSLHKPSKMQVIVLAEIAALILLVAAFVGIGNSRNSAEAVAKKYFQAYVDKDWEKYYNLTDCPDGKFLQKELFVEMMENTDVPDITGFEVTSGLSSSSGIQKTYYVEYTVKGQGTDTIQLDLIKQGTKSMLFFDTWKISSVSDIAQNFSIYVPAGAAVTVDGIALTDSEKAENMDEYMDCYQVTLFAGQHKLQAAVPWFELKEEYFTAYAGESYAMSDFVLTDEGEMAIQAKMQEALEEIYQAAAEEKDFSEVEDLFLDEYKESGRDSYDYLMENLNDSENYSLNYVTYSNFECDIYPDSYTGVINADMSYDFDLNYTYTYRSWFDDSTKQEIESYDGSTYMTATFGSDGETYKLMSVNIRSLL